MSIKSYLLGPGTFKLNVPATLAGITTANASTTITSATAQFVSGDVGQPVSGTGIPGGATIAAVVSPTQATLSAAATASGTVSITITPAQVSDQSCQMRSGEVEPIENVTTAEAVPHLCGEDLPAEDTVTLSWRFKASATQDLSAGGFVDFTWANASKVVRCEYVPNTVLGRAVKGVVRVIPLKVGGSEAKKRPTNDIDWAMPLQPSLT